MKGKRPKLVAHPLTGIRYHQRNVPRKIKFLSKTSWLIVAFQSNSMLKGTPERKMGKTPLPFDRWTANSCAPKYCAPFLLVFKRYLAANCLDAVSEPT